MNRPKAILALDIGLARSGAAVSSESGSIALGAGVWKRGGYRDDLAAVRRIVGEREIGTIIVGYPLNTDGSEGEQARIARAVAEKLNRDLKGITVELEDERFTTLEAREEIARIAGRSKRAKRAPVDQIAAQLILRRRLDRLADGGR